MSTTDLTLGGVALSTAVPEAIVLRPSRPLAGRRRHEYVEIPGKAGSWKFTEAPGDRRLDFELHIEAASFAARRAAVVALADWCDLGSVAPLIVADEPDVYHSVLFDGDPTPSEWLNQAAIVLSFIADPYTLAAASSTETLAVTGAGSDSDSFTISDQIEAEPVIEITPNDGTLETFTLTIAGRSLVYAGPSIGSGNTITINSISDTVTTGVSGDTMLTGAYNPASLVMGLISGEFPILVPGLNTWSISWTGSATDITVAIEWRRRYR